MSEALDNATSRARVAVTFLTSSMLILLLPSLLIASSDTAGSVALVVAALGFASLCRFGIRHLLLASRTRVMAVPRCAAVVPVVPGRVTDRVHHPLRPRAPGRA